MNILQEEILKRIISHYKETGVNSFDTSGFNTLENISLNELEEKGYVSISPDIIQTVSLSKEIISMISKKQFS